MHHMVFLNPRRTKARGLVRRRSLPKRGLGGRFLSTSRAFRNVRRRKGYGFNNQGSPERQIRFVSSPKQSNNMATRTRRSRRSSVRRRVRRNPPKMTPAMRRKIGARIRALHRAGKYKRRRSGGGSVRRVSRRRSASRSLVVRSAPRRVSRRRRSGGGGGGGMMSGGGFLGIRNVLRSDNVKMAVGALGATFAVNYGTALIVPRLPASVQTNPFVKAFIKIAITGITAKVVNRWSRPAAQGVLIGGLLVVANDLIRAYAPGMSGAAMSQYLGGRRNPGLPAVSPTNPTFARSTAQYLGGVYGGGSAFKGDAWSR